MILIDISKKMSFKINSSTNEHIPLSYEYLLEYAIHNFHSSNYNIISYYWLKCKVNSELNPYSPFDYLNDLTIGTNEISQVILAVLSTPFRKFEKYELVVELYERIKNTPFSILFKHLLDFVLKDFQVTQEPRNQQLFVKEYMSNIDKYYVRYLEHLKKNPIVKENNTITI